MSKNVARRAADATTAVGPQHTATGVERCVESVRAMIFSGELMPGQKVHQAELANQLEVSRVPVREALSRLHAEGLLVHRSNAGFTVARFSRAELSEIYMMRRLLETQLLRTMPLEQVDLSLLEATNAELRDVSPRDSPELYQRLNIRFHFTIFAASPQELLRAEIERLWNMSAYYRSARLFVTEDPSLLCAEHDFIIEGIRSADVEGLVKVVDQHRSGTERVDTWLRGHHLPAAG